MRRFWLLLKPDKLEIRNVYVYAIFTGLIQLTLPIGIQAIINLIQGGAVSASWFLLVFLVVGGIALGGILQINQMRITENLEQKIFTRAAFEFAYRIPRIRLAVLLKKYAPELMNRFFDIVSIQKALSKILIDFSSALIQVLFGLILLSFYHPFFILFGIFLVFMVYIIIRLTAQRGLDTSMEESKRKYEIAHWLQEVAKANYTFKLAGKTDLPLEQVNETSAKYVKARDAHFSILIKQYGLMVVFKVLVALGLLLIGGILVIEQQMNIGQFVAAEIIILLVINSVEKMVMNFETIYDVLTSLEKIAQVTDLEMDPETGMTLSNSDAGLAVSLEDVRFQYPDEQREALRNIDLTIASGERIWISGQNDSGKSTLLYLMAGLFPPSSGSLSINDIPIQNYHPELLRSSIGGYLRDESLFEGTLLENITLGREKATFENVSWAVKALGLASALNRLPMGFDTKIHPHGRQFSKSTVAKILIARAIVDKPRLLLLENSFSVFSDLDRMKILEFLLDKKHPWTVVLTSSQNMPISHLCQTHIELSAGEIIKITDLSC